MSDGLLSYVSSCRAHDDCLVDKGLALACGRRYLQDVMGLRIGARVRYRGWRGDSGTGTVVDIVHARAAICIKRDSSADVGAWFFPLRDSERVEPL